MKIFTIFGKNLKIVSRNWSYFLVLFICPVLLILISGATLNSGDYNNIRIGVVDENPDYQLNLGNLRNIYPYESLSECMYGLTNKKVSACLHLTKHEGNQIDIHLDNSVKRVEYYARQYILENILQEQSQSFQETTEEISSQLTLYSTSMENAKQELQLVKSDLIEQEALLHGYKTNLTTVRNDFMEVKQVLDEIDPTVRELEEMLNSNSVQENITMFRQKKQEMDILINNLRVYLQSTLSPIEYSNVGVMLDQLQQQLDDMGQILSDIESQQQAMQELSPLIYQYDEIMAKMEKTEKTLNQLDQDLDKSIQKTKTSQQRVDSFLQQLDKATEDMGGMSQNLKSGNLEVGFKQAFTETDKPVFYVYPMLVAIIITFTSLVLSNMFILKQINQPSYQREMITPTGDLIFLFADYLINLFFVAIQAVVLFLVGHYWLNVPLTYLQAFAVAIFLTSSVFIFMGMSISYLVRNQSLSMLLTTFLLILLLILSDILSPSVIAGTIIKFVISLNPFYVLTNILEDLIIVGKDMFAIRLLLYKQGIFLFVAFIVGYLSKKVCRESIIQ